MDAIQVLSKEGVDLWNVAEYLLLYEEALAGKQDASWETRWHKLRASGTGYVNVIYKNKLENKVTSSLVLQYLTKEDSK